MSMTGTGKTLCAVMVAKKLSPHTIPVLVVCPKAVIPSWRRELDEQGVSGEVINYEKLKTGSTKFGHWEAKKWVWTVTDTTLIIFDEVQKCKNPSSQNCRMAIAAKTHYVLMLSATVADNPTEMRAVGYLLGLFDLQKFHNWCKSHGCFVNHWGKMEFAKGKRHKLTEIHQQIVPDKGHRLFVEDMQGHFAENFILDDPIDFGDDGKIAEIYNNMGAELEVLKSAMADDSTSPAAQALVAQLRARQGVELLKVPLIEEMIYDILDEGRSVAVFVNFDATMDALIKRVIDKVDTRLAAIRGGQTEKERQAAIDAFQDNTARVIFCNITAGGVGVSLHDTTGEAPRTALISPSFDAKAIVQVLGRIHRAGGKTPAIQRILVASGTIEEKVAKALKEKIVNQETLNGTPETVSDTCAGCNIPLTTEEPKMDNQEIKEINHSEREHAEHSPSQLKYFEVCGGYRPREGTNPAAERGTRIHEALQVGDPSRLVDEYERGIAEKCHGYLTELMSQFGGAKYTAFDEERLEIDLGGGEKTFGTCDVLRYFPALKRGLMIDYKTGYGAIDDAEINTQAWAYVIGAFQKLPDLMEVDFYFLIPMRDEVSYATFHRTDLPKMKLRLQTVIARAKEGSHRNPQEGVCDYCGNKATCAALAEKVFLIAKKFPREGYTLPELPPEGVSSVEDPETLSKLLKIAPIVEDWAKQVKAYATEKAVNELWEIPGYRLTERSTPRVINNPLAAWNALKDTVKLEDFLAAVSRVSVPDLEKYYAESAPRGKKGQAKQELNNRLIDAEAMTQEGVIHVLKAEKE